MEKIEIEPNTPELSPELLIAQKAEKYDTLDKLLKTTIAYRDGLLEHFISGEKQVATERIVREYKTINCKCELISKKNVEVTTTRLTVEDSENIKNEVTRVSNQINYLLYFLI